MGGQQQVKDLCRAGIEVRDAVRKERQGEDRGEGRTR